MEEKRKQEKENGKNKGKKKDIKRKKEGRRRLRWRIGKYETMKKERGHEKKKRKTK